MDETPITKEDLDRAHRKLCRQAASLCLALMADTDMGFSDVASAMGVTETWLRRWFRKLMDGTARDMREASDLATAMGREIRLSTTPIHQPAE